MTKSKNTDKLVKVLQIASIVLMVAMVIATVIFLKVNNISVKNVESLTKYLQGGQFTIALILIAFTVVKSFVLVFPPIIVFALSGMVFDSIWVAWLVNIIAMACSMILPYYLGKFTGKSMVDSMKKKFPKVKKIDDFAEANDFALVFVIKASGFIPCDVSSLIFGAMNISFWRYLIAANLGMIPLNVLWTLLGAKGDLSNPLSFLYVLPIAIFAICAAVFMKFWSKKKEEQKTK